MLPALFVHDAGLIYVLHLDDYTAIAFASVTKSGAWAWGLESAAYVPYGLKPTVFGGIADSSTVLRIKEGGTSNRAEMIASMRENLAALGWTVPDP